MQDTKAVYEEKMSNRFEEADAVLTESSPSLSKPGAIKQDDYS